MSWDWLGDFIVWWTAERIAAGAAVVAASAAVAAAISGTRTLRQNRRDSQARSRPMVAAELREVPYVRGTQILVVRNYGPTIAHKVRVSFDPEIPDPPIHSPSATPFLERRYAEQIPLLVPGMELDNIYFSGRQEGGSWINAEPTPDSVKVTIVYENSAGDSYKDVFPLDTNFLRNRTYVESSSSPEAQMKILATSAKTLADLAVETDHRLGIQASTLQRAAHELGNGSSCPKTTPSKSRGPRALLDRLLHGKVAGKVLDRV